MRDPRETPTPQSKERVNLLSGPPIRRVHIPRRHLPKLPGGGALQAHAGSRWSRASSRGAAEKPEPQRLRHLRTPSLGRKRLRQGRGMGGPKRGDPLSALSVESPSRGPVAFRAFRLAERTMGPGSGPCPRGLPFRFRWVPLWLGSPAPPPFRSPEGPELLEVPDTDRGLPLGL